MDNFEKLAYDEAIEEFVEDLQIDAFLRLFDSIRNEEQIAIEAKDACDDIFEAIIKDATFAIAG